MFSIKPGLVVLFGSGEMSPTGRKIHEDIFLQSAFIKPVSVGILETPTGFEVNAIHAWPERMGEFFTTGLKNWNPQVTRVRAWRRDGSHSTNDQTHANEVLDQEYLYCGAGSPSYVVEHMQNSLVYSALLDAHANGTAMCFGSATAIAIGAYALPVYEIFKAGKDPYWQNGLNFFSQYNLNLVIVPHWNNAEGDDFDTTRCYMGEKRFAILQKSLPKGVTILGIDEQTACVFDMSQNLIRVVGIGNLTIIRDSKQTILSSGSQCGFNQL